MNKDQSITHLRKCNQECNQEYGDHLRHNCKPCNSTSFKNDFDEWTRGNDTCYYKKVIETIDFKILTKCQKVVLVLFIMLRGNDELLNGINGIKKVDCIGDINKDFLNEMSIHRKTMDTFSSIRFYDITKDPETRKYMMVIEYAKDGNLRNYLSYLIRLAIGFREFRNVFGVLPYIAPEVLGGKDIQRLMSICNEIITGLPMSLKICNGLHGCWDARLDKYNNEITIPIKEAEEVSKNQETIDTTTTTSLNYKTRPQAIYTSRPLNFLNLPKPINKPNFEKNLKN
ncbi:hypothetical protein Glove_276g92 [Diversispora epigaea]|uniref:Serine-threonine/tyrosine-protein kinase catalytic domain-containing protein n=1 Tax=Diversispora epigaea TaxID=1348612 RepID=A0A397I9Z8_9GLOM|nr:hypothetical protein Glove_276g92 [Diversispora epigaea]